MTGMAELGLASVLMPLIEDPLAAGDAIGALRRYSTSRCTDTDPSGAGVTSVVHDVPAGHPLRQRHHAARSRVFENADPLPFWVEPGSPRAMATFHAIASLRIHGWDNIALRYSYPAWPGTVARPT